MNISFELVDSRSEMLEVLRRSPNAVSLGDSNESTKDFFKCDVKDCTIGIYSQGSGIKPSGFVDDATGECWIGFDSEIANIDLREGRVRFDLKLAWVFYTILCQMVDGSIVVIYELGACRIDRSGNVAWNCATDLVTDYCDRDSVVILRTDGGEVIVDKERGTVLQEATKGGHSSS